jgi:propionyl-CoA synthetase
VVFGGFAAKELSSRIDDCAPKLILTASCGIEPSRIVQYKPLVDQAIEQAKHKPRVILLQRPQCAATMVAGRDLDWNEALAKAQPAPCVQVKATDPLYILYTSGTTGQPKGVVRDTGGYCVALAVVDEEPLRRPARRGVLGASDVGWVVGHSYIVYGPLIHGEHVTSFTRASRSARPTRAPSGA